MEYLDFELEIGAVDGGSRPVRVLESPAGEVRGRLDFPWAGLALDHQLQTVELLLLRSTGHRRRRPTGPDARVADFGTALYRALFTGPVRTHWELSRREAARLGKGLRLKLRVDDPVLAAIPWEFLRDPDRDEYLCLSRSTPVVRSIEMSRPEVPLEVAGPLRVLAMAASPADLPALDVTHERERLEEATADLRDRGALEVEWMAGEGWRDLQRVLRQGPWHVFHFIGHGHFDDQRDEGLVSFTARDGSARDVTASELGRLLADHGPLRLAVLNACEGARGGDRDVFSSTSSILVRRGIPAVVAMQYEVTDPAAIELSHAFYEALADGLAVDDALTEARKAVSFAIADTIEWATPVLHMHAPDGVLFQVVARPGDRALAPGRSTSPDDTPRLETARHEPPPESSGSESSGSESPGPESSGSESSGSESSGSESSGPESSGPGAGDIVDATDTTAMPPPPAPDRASEPPAVIPPGGQWGQSIPPMGVAPSYEVDEGAVPVVVAAAQVFGAVGSLPKGNPAGVEVIEGALRPPGQVRIVRDGEVVHLGDIGLLHVNYADVPQLAAGSQGVLGVIGWFDVRPGDLVQQVEFLTNPSERARTNQVAALVHDGHVIMIEITTSQIRVLYDGEVVSSHSTWKFRAPNHDFDIVEDGEDVHYEVRMEVKWNLRWWWEVRRNGVLLHSDK